MFLIKTKEESNFLNGQQFSFRTCSGFKQQDIQCSNELQHYLVLVQLSQINGP